MNRFADEPIHVTVQGSSADPRDEAPVPPGVIVHREPDLHPDDVTVVDGIPVTSVSRTLVDLAEVLSPDELREAFARARELGLLDVDAVEGSFARLPWRPSLGMLRDVMEEFHA